MVGIVVGSGRGAWSGSFLGVGGGGLLALFAWKTATTEEGGNVVTVFVGAVGIVGLTRYVDTRRKLCLKL